MLNFEKRTLKFAFDGGEHTVNFPTVKQLQGYRKKFEEVKDDADKIFDITLDFLESLGLKKEIALEMENDHIETIIQHISGQKKK